MTAGVPPLILSVFSTFAVGGPQVRFSTLANHLGQDYRHAIVAMDGQMDCARRLAPTLRVAYPQVEIRKGATLANARRFRRVLRQLRPDILVTSNWGSIEWALANAVPLAKHIHIEDGFGPEERSVQLRRRVLMRRALLGRCTVVLPSLTLWRIARGVWRLPEAGLRHIPNGIDLVRFSPVREPSRPGEGPVVGTVAALRPEKNLPRLLRAFRLLSQRIDARLVIGGDGPERPRLEALVEDLGLRDHVEFVGHVDDPSRLYARFDVFALSSDTEQMPLSVLEAMAAGLPAAATDVGDVRAMLCEANAPFVVQADDDALAGSLSGLLADPALRRRIGADNRARAEGTYSEEAMLGAYRGLFEDVRRPDRPS